MDWSILYYKNGKITVRQKRVYPTKIVCSCVLRYLSPYSFVQLYIWAAVSNLVLRFTWSLTKSNLLQLVSMVQWEFVVLIGACEILRRAQWNLFRMENEHLNNCGKFRAVEELELPV